MQPRSIKIHYLCQKLHLILADNIFEGDCRIGYEKGSKVSFVRAEKIMNQEHCPQALWPATPLFVF